MRSKAERTDALSCSQFMLWANSRLMLTDGQWAVLEALNECSPLDAATLRDRIEQRKLLALPDPTAALERLEREGLVRPASGGRWRLTGAGILCAIARRCWPGRAMRGARGKAGDADSPKLRWGRAISWFVIILALAAIAGLMM